MVISSKHRDWRKVLLVAVILILVIYIIPVGEAVVSECTIENSQTCSSGYKILGLSSLTNAHVEAKDSNKYGYSLCCTGLEAETVDGTGEWHFALYTQTNAHIQINDKGTLPGYIYNFKYKFKGLGPQDCGVNSYLPDGAFEILSVSGKTNAHAAELGSYNLIFYCGEPVPEECSDGTSIGNYNDSGFCCDANKALVVDPSSTGDCNGATCPYGMIPAGTGTDVYCDYAVCGDGSPSPDYSEQDIYDLDENYDSDNGESSGDVRWIKYDYSTISILTDKALGMTGCYCTYGIASSVPPYSCESCTSTETKETSCTDGKDNDCDTYADCDDPDCSTDPACASDADGDGYLGVLDCDDTNNKIWQNIDGYTDADGDDYGTGAVETICSGSNLPSGYALNSEDCNDNDDSINPGVTEVCGDGIDNNCDGSADENCGCNAGETQDCGTTDVGACEYGTQLCRPDGSWGPCLGAKGPTTEVCDDTLDNDCDGNTDSDDSECEAPECTLDTECETDEICEDNVCVAVPPECTSEESPKDCSYTGPIGTEGVGECIAGSQICTDGSWEDCDGEVVPETEDCNDNLDNDCDGYTDTDDEDCDCEGDETRQCGSSQGICEFGNQTCINNIWGSCVGGVGPEIEFCDELDNNCDGRVDEGFDADSDGVANCVDNCPNTLNPNQEDTDNDGKGDACEDIITSVKISSSKEELEPDELVVFSVDIPPEDMANVTVEWDLGKKTDPWGRLEFRENPGVACVGEDDECVLNRLPNPTNTLIDGEINMSTLEDVNNPCACKDYSDRIYPLIQNNQTSIITRYEAFDVCTPEGEEPTGECEVTVYITDAAGNTLTKSMNISITVAPVTCPDDDSHPCSFSDSDLPLSDADTNQLYGTDCCCDGGYVPENVSNIDSTMTGDDQECILEVECSGDSDCAAGEVCYLGECIGEPAECTIDENCSLGEVCSQGACIQKGGEELCGNDICDLDYSENYINCVEDCHCGDGACQPAYFESEDNCPQDCKKSAAFQIIALIIVFIAGIVLYILYSKGMLPGFVGKGKEEEEAIPFERPSGPPLALAVQHNVSIPSNSTSSLSSYIKSCRAQGISYTQIKQSLLNKGWPEDQINKVFGQVA